MPKDAKNYVKFDRSFGKWIKNRENNAQTVNINSFIPIQRKSILTVISSSESLDDFPEESLSDQQWMSIIASKDHKNQFNKNKKTIKISIIKKGAPKEMFVNKPTSHLELLSRNQQLPGQVPGF